MKVTEPPHPERWAPRVRKPQHPQIQIQEGTNLKIATINTRGLATEERMVELEMALEERNEDIIGLSEIRKIGEQIITRENGNLFYYLGENKGRNGVGFMVKKNVRKYVTEIKGVNDRIAILKLEISDKEKLKIIQIYAPTSVASEHDHRNFYNKLQEIIDEPYTNLQEKNHNYGRF